MRLCLPPGSFNTEDIDSGNIIQGSWRTGVTGENGLNPLKKTPRKVTVYRIFMSPSGTVPWQQYY